MGLFVFTERGKMKAWEFEYKIRESIKPDPNYKPVWDIDSGFSEDNILRMKWESFVPGSGAIEHLIVGAVQSVENMGRDVTEAEKLLEIGFKVFENSDFGQLKLITKEMFENLERAPLIKGHKYYTFRRPTEWEEISKEFPETSYPMQGDSMLFDRIYAGWLGQIAGASMGTRLEGFTSKALQEVFGESLGKYIYKPSTLNDDITYEIAFIPAFKDKKRSIDSEFLSKKWVELIPFGWSAELVALENLKKGILPPLSGIKLNPFQEWIGAQMRCMVHGFLSPYNPSEAARLAFIDSQISHSGNGIYGGIHSAVLVSLAFLVDEPIRLVTESLKYIPEHTEFQEVLEKTINWCRNAKSYEEVIPLIEDEFKQYNWVHLYPNAACVITSLWFSNGIFDKAMKIVAQAGFDVDCNAGEVGSIIGVMKGMNALSDYWIKPFNDNLETYVRGFENIKISELTELTVKLLKETECL